MLRKWKKQNNLKKKSLLLFVKHLVNNFCVRELKELCNINVTRSTYGESCIYHISNNI